MFYSKLLSNFKNLKHCFFSRENGVSSGVYKSLNCGLGSNDSKNKINKNLRIVSGYIGCENNSLITLKQNHTNKVIFFKDYNSARNKMNADAFLTKEKNIGLGILTADCVPILLYDPVNKVIGAIHAGWKGALKGIIKNAIDKFLKLDCKTDHLIAAVGPSIGKDSYEVGIDFFEKFLEQNKKNDKFFIKYNNNKYKFDLRQFVNDELKKMNLKKIDNIDIDTFKEEKLFFSYRRSKHNKDSDYGRCISVILMT